MEPPQYDGGYWGLQKRGFLATPAKRFRFERDIETLSQRIMTIY